MIVYSLPDNALLAKIDGKDFFIQNIEIDDDGRVSYDVSCEGTLTEHDKNIVDEFMYKLVCGELYGTD